MSTQKLPVSLFSRLLASTKASRRRLGNRVHFVPFSPEVVRELLPIGLSFSEFNTIYSSIENSLNGSIPSSIDINNIASIVSSAAKKRLGGERAIKVLSSGKLVGVLCSTLANASKLVTNEIKKVTGIDLHTGHSAGGVQLVKGRGIDGYIWLKNNYALRTPGTAKLSAIQEVYTLGEYVLDGKLDQIIEHYFEPQGRRFTPKSNFTELQSIIKSTGLAFPAKLQSIDDKGITASDIKNALRNFGNQHFKKIPEYKAKYNITADIVGMKITEAINQIADKHQEYFDRVVDKSVITREFTDTAASLSISIVLPQTPYINKDELGIFERQAINRVEKFLNLIDLGGPTNSVRGHIEQALTDAVVHGKVKKRVSTERAFGGKPKIVENTRSKVSGVKEPKAKLSASGPAILRDTRGRFASVTNLEGLIRSMLLQTILKNMQRPNLRNRTGRFARSIELVGLQIDRDGSLLAKLTYMKYPYATFSVTGAQGFRGYYPERLIDQSVREIAAKLIKNRLRTKVV